ncbi:protein crumbs isoform X1 [Onthophagus taurus]|uniref:protein crumbs isoform X1 n=2 Tax=Onthophagus taurus TaxID=166361 RepID=UPI0039BE1334
MQPNFSLNHQEVNSVFIVNCFLLTTMIHVLFYVFLTASLTLGQIIGPSNQPEAYFNGSTYIRLQTTVSLKKQTGLSFKTCEGGELFSQTHKDNVIELSLEPSTGWLKFSGKTLGKQFTERVQGNFSDNKWHHVHIFYVLGNLTLNIDDQYRLLANSTFRTELLNSPGLYNDGAVLIIGKHYDGCIMEGPSIVFNKSFIQSHEVRFGLCPINDDCGIHETKAACLLAPCMDHGQCIEVNNSYKCICNSGYVGTNCERVLKPCETHACLNGGTCIDNDDKVNFHCECPPKFTGKYCETPISLDPVCSSNPCKNGGTCQNDGTTTRCICLDGFSGADCSVNLDDCQQNPCKNNGVCNDGIDSFTCNCTNTGYQGQFCEKNINECLEAPCLNGGKCFDNYGDYFCQCTSGYYGKNCDQRISECDSSPCFNQGVCNDQENGYICVCPSGFTGTQCEISLRQAQLQCGCEPFGLCVDDGRCICRPEYTGEYPNCKPHCTVNICKNGGTCWTTSTSVNCSCPINFEGDYCEKRIEDCTTTPCLNRGKCNHSVFGGYICECPEFWMGRFCEQQYVYCENNNCKNNGTCKMYSSTRESFCDCQSGFKGTFCEEYDEDCNEPNCYTERNDSCHCQENAKCVPNTEHGYSGYTCECLEGYSGPNCIDIDECKTGQPCEQGICKNIPGGFECYCKPGYSGEKCNLDINECLSSPCKNSATCRDRVNNYDCVCLPGYTGKNCEIDINECDPNPCMYNSKCSDLINDFKCQCEDGRTGHRCETDIDDCQPQPCQNDGICVDHLNRYECNCTDTGYEGEHCENNIDDCKTNPCVNEGVCIDLIKDYSCQCREGYTGKDCESDINECASQPCQNGGECIERSNQTLYQSPYNERLPPNYQQPFSYQSAFGFDCLCVNGTIGLKCETNVNECESNPCHYGKCIDQVGFYTCECNDGFEGKHCDIDINECDKYQPCVHGTCRDGRATYYCDCNPDYGGKNCSVLLLGCKKDSCNYKGTCRPYVINEMDHHFNCSCQSGFYGDTCETTTTMSLSGTTLITVNTSKDEGYDISFRFKTTLSDGLLAVGIGQTYYILELNKGRLNLHSSLLNKWEGVFIGSGLNNSNWQRVFVAINTTHIILSANDEQTIYPITYNDYNASATSFPSTYIGGTTSELRTLTHKPPLVGCVEDVIVNTAWVLPTSQTANITLHDVDVGCHREPQCKPNPCHSGGQCTDNWRNFSCTCERPHLGHICQYNYTAATFCHENITNSLVTVKVDKDAKRAVRSIVDISMFIRTRESSGQIFYLGSEKRDQSETYIAAELENGELLVRIEIHGNAESYIVGGVKLDNGYNHLIEVIRNVTLVQVKLNGTEYFRKTISATGHLDAEILYLGGQQPNLRSVRQATDPNAKSEILPSGPAAITAHNEIHFKGIIQDVQISNGSKIMVVEFFPLKVQDLYIPMSFGNVSFDESLVLPGVLSDNKCLLNPCGDGKCLNTWNDYQCICPRGFKGKDCKEREFCKLEQCPLDSECKNLDEGLECITNITFAGDTPPLKYGYTLTNISWIETIELSFRSRSWGTILYAHYEMNHFLIFTNNGEILVECMMLGRRAHNKFKKDHYDGQWITLLFTIHDLTLKGGFKESVTDDTPNFTFSDFDAGNFTEIFVKGELYIGGTGDVKLFDYTNLIQNNNGSDELDDNKLDTLNGGFRISKNKLNDYFKGCLSEIRINNYLLPFFPNEILPNITVKNFNLTSNQIPSVGCKLCFNKDCNRGTCADPFTLYKCNCPLGFTEDDCSVDINECEDNQCKNNATCKDEIGKYSCVCLNGYDGLYCENEIDECESSPCLHGGSCTDLIGNYSCECTDEFTGINCERQKVITCLDHPCADGATCKNENKKGNNFTCLCPPGIIGDRCDMPYCKAKKCENNGFCNVNGLQPRCECELGYDGDYCEYNIDECASFPCQNNGECKDLVNEYICGCDRTGYTGLNCEVDINECDAQWNPCGQGKCTNTPGSYRCTCENQKCGLYCNLDDPCLNNPCAHGSCEAMCTNSTDYLCKCPPDWTGKNCSDVQALKAEEDSGVNILFIVIPVVVVIVVGLGIGLVVLVNIARSKRATRGTYSPSAQEFCNPRVELDHVLKPPPEERLI